MTKKVRFARKGSIQVQICSNPRTLRPTKTVGQARTSPPFVHAGGLPAPQHTQKLRLADTELSYFEDVLS